jgi:hypothetical protein
MPPSEVNQLSVMSAVTVTSGELVAAQDDSWSVIGSETLYRTPAEQANETVFGPQNDKAAELITHH